MWSIKSTLESHIASPACADESLINTFHQNVLVKYWYSLLTKNWRTGARLRPSGWESSQRTMRWMSLFAATQMEKHDSMPGIIAHSSLGLLWWIPPPPHFDSNNSGKEFISLFFSVKLFHEKVIGRHWTTVLHQSCLKRSVCPIHPFSLPGDTDQHLEILNMMCYTLQLSF